MIALTVGEAVKAARSQIAYAYAASDDAEVCALLLTAMDAVDDVTDCVDRKAR